MVALWVSAVSVLPCTPCLRSNTHWPPKLHRDWHDRVLFDGARRVVASVLSSPRHAVADANIVVGRRSAPSALINLR